MDVRKRRAWSGAFAAATLALAGCAGAGDQPTISRDVLAADLTRTLHGAGETPQQVTCGGDLVADAGSSTRCAVTLVGAGEFEVIVTATGVEGSTLTYSTAPALTSGQVAEVVNSRFPQQLSSVDCKSGLEGDVGTVVYCDIVTGQQRGVVGVEITDISGLVMTTETMPVLAVAELESLLADELVRQVGMQPESVSCTGDLVGKPGETTACTVRVGDGRTSSYIVTVDTVDGLKIDFDFEPAG